MLTQSSSSSSSGMSHLNTGFDNDLDSFLNLDQSAYTPASTSPALGKQIHRPSFASSSTSFAGQSQHTFSGPSFQYDAYKQQTGLPIGGLANTFAVNQAMGLQYNGSHSGFVMPIETLNIPLSNLDEFDFSSNPSIDMQDVDFDADSPSDMYKGRYVNPNALLGQDDSPTYAAPVRMYPGIHQQQAAQAKAQQLQKQQEMAARQQQQEQQQQQQRPIEGQQPLPTQSKSSGEKDPHVEESISRLLSQMRHNSVASADDADTPTGSQPSLAARLKKEEDEMDEDERLLASEEGKKLSSKERRQLRNKVSARAFRSRRKEYIGQLEGEVAQKVQEADDLRAQNRQLMEENTRLTDLTRMLLSSPAFSGFLNELSANGMPAPPTTTLNQQSQTKSQPRPTRKDVNPHQASRQMQNQQPQINMAMIPETSIDFSALEQSANTWNSIPSNDFQVFSVPAVPLVPMLDMKQLSGKAPSLSASLDTTKETPRIAETPEWVKNDRDQVSTTGTEDNLDQAFDLYNDLSTTSTTSTPYSLDSYLASLKPETITSTLDLTCTVHETSSAQLERMCCALDETCEQLAAYLPAALSD